MPPRHHRPLRPNFKPWLPEEGEQGGGSRDDPTADSTHDHKEPQADADDVDDLDALLDMYSTQAAAEAAAVRSAAAARSGKKKGMKERREEGLNKPLAPDNKGFQLMAKMGYQAGQGLGSSTKGRSEPVEMDIRGARSGLGVYEEKKRKRQQQQQAVVAVELHRARQVAARQELYCRSAAASFSSRKVKGHLTTAKAACEALDVRAGTANTSVLLMLPQPQEEEEEEGGDAIASKAEEEEELAGPEMSEDEQLQLVLQYLRSTHHYCHFCGCQYNDMEDLATNCPGMMEEDH